MKNNQLTAWLLGLFFLSVVSNVVVFYKYNASLHRAQGMQSSAMVINIVQSLLNDAGEYGKTHPDMQRFLQTPPPQPAGAVKPAAPVKSR